MPPHYLAKMCPRHVIEKDDSPARHARRKARQVRCDQTDRKFLVPEADNDRPTNLHKEKHLHFTY